MSAKESGQTIASQLTRAALLLLLGIFFFGDDVQRSAPLAGHDSPSIELDGAHGNVAVARAETAPAPSPSAIPHWLSIEPQTVVSVEDAAPGISYDRSLGLRILRYAPSHSPPRHS